LRNGTDVVLGNTSAGTYSTRVVPGNYELYYQFQGSLLGGLAPWNMMADIRCFTVQ